VELKQVIIGRRSIRHYTDNPVKREELIELLEAAKWAPSAGNIQPWAFICVTDTHKLNNIQVLSPGMLGNPKAIICVCSDQKRALERAGEGGKTLAMFDCAMATQNILLRAHDLGLGSCVIRSFNQAAIQEILSIPEHMLPELLITIGYPTTSQTPPKRRNDVFFWEEYGKGEKI